MEGLEVQQAAAVGEVLDGDVDPVRLELLQQRPEKLPLLLVVIVPLDLARGEVREDALDGEVRQLEDLLDRAEGLAVDRAAAAHARVDLDVDGHPGLGLLELLLEFPGKAQIGDGRGDAVLDDLVDLEAHGGAQDEDRRLDAAHAQLHPLVGVGDAQEGRAVADGHIGDLDRAVAVGVGLHDGEDLHVGPHELAHLVPVVGEVVQVDFDPASVVQPVSLLSAHGVPVPLGLLPGNAVRIHPDTLPETLPENAGIAKGEDSFHLDKDRGWVYKFPFQIDGMPM